MTRLAGMDALREFLWTWNFDTKYSWTHEALDRHIALVPAVPACLRRFSRLGAQD
jgi:hypothetical protein